jgi:hypothetical protein
MNIAALNSSSGFSLANTAYPNFGKLASINIKPQAKIAFPQPETKFDFFANLGILFVDQIWVAIVGGLSLLFQHLHFH